VKTQEVRTARVRRNSQQPSRLVRLAVVFADPIRLKIVTELFRREMSPSQFVETYGGGSLPRVNRHFKRLEEHHWLRLVHKATGGHRRGSTEHFYRAPELAIIGEETWPGLPASLKTEFSWRTFEQFAERVKQALEAGTFDARGERHFTWTPLVLDEEGRSRIIASIDALFRLLLEEQADAKIRLGASEGKPIHATAGLAAFDSPNRQRNRSGLVLPAPSSSDTEEASPTHFTVRIARVLSHPLNLKIMTELNLREMSASEFAESYPSTSLSDVNRRFKLLEGDGWLVKVRTESGGRRRGAKEHFYRAIGPAVFDTRQWTQVPEHVRGSFSWRVFEQLAEQVREAMTAGTFDSRPDRHHTWTPLILDELGWGQVIEGVDQQFRLLFREQEAAKARLARSGESPVIATVYLAAFESPSVPPTPHSI
jgi:DNA-binding transcriptional ArsR family regulator